MQRVLDFVNMVLERRINLVEQHGAIDTELRIKNECHKFKTLNKCELILFEKI